MPAYIRFEDLDPPIASREQLDEVGDALFQAARAWCMENKPPVAYLVVAASGSMCVLNTMLPKEVTRQVLLEALEALDRGEEEEVRLQ